jgi:hypothetical protein
MSNDLPPQPPTPPGFAFLTEAERSTTENRLLMLSSEVSALRADHARVSARHGEMLAELLDGKRQASRARTALAEAATLFLEKLGVL